MTWRGGECHRSPERRLPRPYRRHLMPRVPLPEGWIDQPLPRRAIYGVAVVDVPLAVTGQPELKNSCKRTSPSVPLSAYETAAMSG